MSKHNKYLQFQEHMDNNKQLGLGTVRLKETNIFMQLQITSKHLRNETLQTYHIDDLHTPLHYLHSQTLAKVSITVLQATGTWEAGRGAGNEASFTPLLSAVHEASFTPPKSLTYKINIWCRLGQQITHASMVYCLLASHLVPDHPGSQLHAPFAAKHVPLSLQLHVIAHSSPHRPCGQTIEQRQNHKVSMRQEVHRVCSLLTK